MRKNPIGIMDSSGNSDNNSDNTSNKMITTRAEDKWPEDADIILEKIRCNSIIMSEYHKTNYFILNSRLKYFRIPIIIISAFASVLNIGLQPFLDQQYISILCCLLSLVTGLIGSIEMFLQVQKKMENELINSRDFYLNAIEIFKVLSLDPNNRNGDGLKFLDAKFGVYIKMIENSNIMEKEIIDQLAPIDPKLVIKYTGNLNNASILLTRATHKVNKRVNRHIKHTGKITLSDILFFRFFWGNSGGVGSVSEEDGNSIDSEDRFNIYQDLIQKVNNKDIDPSVLEKIAPILTFAESKNEMKLEDRMKVYSMLQNSGKFDPSIINKLRIILVEEHFTKPQKCANQMRRQTSYENISPDIYYHPPHYGQNIYGNTNAICDIENQHNDLNSLRPLSRIRRDSQVMDNTSFPDPVKDSLPTTKKTDPVDKQIQNMFISSSLEDDLGS